MTFSPDQGTGPKVEHDVGAVLRSSEWWDWLQTPSGQYLLTWLQGHIDEAVADVFGYHAVELALPGLDCLRANRMSLRVSMVLAGEPWQRPHEERSSLKVESFEDLPFANDSLDLIVLPHALEFADNPHQVLREVERVLRPEGRVVVAGFNPYSLWGLRQLVRPALGRYLPTQAQEVSLPRLRDWFKLLALDLDKGQFGGYAWPARSEKWLGRQLWLERAGDRFWPICGAFYLVSGVKKVRGMRLLGPAWKRGKMKGARAAISHSTHVQSANPEAKP